MILNFKSRINLNPRSKKEKWIANVSTSTRLVVEYMPMLSAYDTYVEQFKYGYWVAVRRFRGPTLEAARRKAWELIVPKGNKMLWEDVPYTPRSQMELFPELSSYEEEPEDEEVGWHDVLQRHELLLRRASVRSP